MFANQRRRQPREAKPFPRVIKTELSHLASEIRPAKPVKRCTAFPADILHDPPCFLRQQPDQVRSGTLDNPRFFPGDHSYGCPKDLNVVTADIGGDGQAGTEHIRGVKSPTQTGLNDRDVDLRPGEVIKGQRSYQLKERDFFFTNVLR